MRDLSPIERDLLRAAALLEAFNADVLFRAGPETRESDVEECLHRSMIERAPLSWLPYSLHESLRNTVIEQDRHTERCWTKRDWRDKATAASDWLAEQVLPVWDTDENLTVPDSAGRQVAAAFLVTLNAAQCHQIIPNKLGELAFLVFQLGFSRIFESSPSELSWDGSASLTRLLAASRIHASPKLGDARKYELLKPLVTFDSRNRYDQFIASIFAPYADVKGRYDEAQAALGSIKNAPRYMEAYSILGQCGSALRSGRLKSALQKVSTSTSHPLIQASRLDLLGHIYIQGGEHEKGAAHFEDALVEAKQSGSPLWSARALRHVAHARMWYDPDGTLAILPEATEINSALNETTGIAQIEMAEALAWAWKGDWTRSETMLQACKSHHLDPVAIGHPGMIEILIALGQGDEDRVRLVADQALRDPRARMVGDRRPHVWLAVIALWSGRTDVNKFSDIEWYDSSTLATERFMRVKNRAIALRSV